MQSYDELMEFLNFCVDYLGTGFHPDTDFSNYIDYRNDERLFSDEQAEIYNKKLSDAFDFCEDNDLDIYELALDLF